MEHGRDVCREENSGQKAMGMVAPEGLKALVDLWFLKCQVYKILEEPQASSIETPSFRDGQLSL